jgi:diguanylate cyclase (GGDEF)-like protein
VPVAAPGDAALIVCQFMPHGLCLAWQRNALPLHVISDGMQALAYFIGSATAAIFAAERRGLGSRRLFVMFELSLVACGVTHLLAIWTIWHPDNWLDGAVKAVTATASLTTAIALATMVPRALAFRSPREPETHDSCRELASVEVQATIDGLGDGVIVYDASFQKLRANAMAEEILQMRIATGDATVDADGVDVPRERWPAVVACATGLPQRNVMLGVGSSEHRRWLVVSATPLSLGRAIEGVDRIVVSVRDVTNSKVRETEQRDYARQLHALHSIASMTTTSRKSQIEAALLVGLEPLGLGRGFFSRVDISTHELVTECSVAADGDWIDDLPVGARYPLRATFIGRAIASNDVLAILDFEAHCRAQGVQNYAHVGSYLAVPIIIDGSPYGAIGFLGRKARTEPFTVENIEFVKITAQLIASSVQRSLQSERLDALAFFDALTGLPNRVLLYDRLVQTILASQRRRERFAVLFLDLDGFKEVNDGYGHAAGDIVLKVVAARLQEALRESDTVARLGGDEFIIIAAGVATVADAEKFADRILYLARMPIEDGEHAHELTASIGVSFYPDDGTEMNTLIEQADVALYQAKHAGKNQIQFARDEAHGPLDGRHPTKTKQMRANGEAQRLARRKLAKASESEAVPTAP